MITPAIRVVDGSQSNAGERPRHEQFAIDAVGDRLESMRTSLLSCTEALSKALPAQIATNLAHTTSVLQRLSCRIAIIGQVKAGKSFTITNRGVAIADLVPSLGARVKDKVAAAEKLKAFMLADPVRGINIRELIEEGRA